MRILSFITILILSCIALFHLLWAFKIWWPLQDEVMLARAVAGFKGISSMPETIPCIIVALLMIFNGYIAFELTKIRTTIFRYILFLIGAGISFVFFARGVIGYLPFWAKLTPEEPFRTLDIAYYSPLCLILGFLFIILTSGFARRCFTF